jgi:hypothetical protein
MRDTRYLVALGGFLGFALTLFGSVAASKDIAIALRDASIGCLIGALMLRAFAQVINACIRAIRVEKARALRARLEAEESAADEREAQTATS